MPRVSVIIPAHDAAQHLSETLESVHHQTFPDWEIVAIDDGSTDDTWSILERAATVRALHNDTPQGPAAARNRALSEADGELAVFLDADDLLLPRYLESQVACYDDASRNRQQVGIVTCDAHLLENGSLAAHTYLDTIRDRGRRLSLDLVLKRNPIYITSLVPMAVGRSVGWFDPELFGTEDFGLWVKILEQGYEAILNPERLVVYRRNAGSVSSNVARQGANNRLMYEQALARGQLNRRQRRIARRAIRYNRAMEAVAATRFGGQRDMRSLLRLSPLLAWVALTNPRWWGQWLSVLRTQRQPPVAQSRWRVPRTRR